MRTFGFVVGMAAWALLGTVSDGVRVSKGDDRTSAPVRVEKSQEELAKRVDDLTKELADVKAKLGKYDGLFKVAGDGYVEITQSVRIKGAAIAEKSIQAPVGLIKSIETRGVLIQNATQGTCLSINESNSEPAITMYFEGGVRALRMHTNGSWSNTSLIQK
jgi:hypothetical protein